MPLALPSSMAPPRPRRFGPSAGTALLLLDVLFAALAWPAAAGLILRDVPVGLRPGFFAFVLFPGACILLLEACGLYRREALLDLRRAVGRLPFAVAAGSLLAAMALLALPLPFPSQGVELLFAAAVPCFMLTGILARCLFYPLRERGGFRRSLLVIGAGGRAHDLVLLLRREAGTLVYDITAVQVATDGPTDPRLAGALGCRVLPPSEDYLRLAQAVAADEIVFAPDERRGFGMAPLIACRTAGYPVRDYLGFLEREIRRVDVKRLELGWLVFSEGFTRGKLDQVLKRALDIAASLTLLALSAPVLLAAVLAVVWQDGGPAIYRQRRVTQHNQVFSMLKLRTMRQDAERTGAVWASAGDPRVTRFGRFLRRSRIDELPQLINVLKGDMSFVGPRPERPEFVAELSAALPLYNERHVMRAGLTGWAQVNYPYGASLDDARSKLSYDLYYVKNYSVLFDLLIILRTLRVVLWPGTTVR